MWALLFTIINDLTAYGNLSGYSVKGHKTCLIWEDNTHFVQLKYGMKTVYLGHKRFLVCLYPYRRLRKRFNGSPAYATAAISLTGEEVYRRVAESLIGTLLHIHTRKDQKRAQCIERLS